jgi:UDP-N-acetylmuramoylalanine--D-glutamate ligase
MTAPEWAGRRVCVTGLGISGAAAARVLLDLGARVLVVEGRDDEAIRATAAELTSRGAEVRLGDAETPVDADLLVTSPGWRPTQPLLVAAQAQGIEVIGEPELAWRLRPSADQPWLGVTGTNGKTTTVGMLASILQAAGYRTVAAGNVGRPLTEVVLADPPYDVLAVEMSSFQLHWSSLIRFEAATILNIAPDHLDWHGSLGAYAADKAKIWGDPQGGDVASVLVNRDDSLCRELAEPFVDKQCFTMAEPTSGCFRYEGDALVDGMSGERLAHISDVHAPGQHNLGNALAAAGLARQLSLLPRYPVPAEAIAAGLSAYRPGPHRNAVVATVDGVTFVDDSKATNPHAAAASLASYDNVVWIAGGLLKGADVEPLVRADHARLRGVVLIGADRTRIRDALARHAPDVPVVEVEATDTGAMTAVVSAARRLAAPGDTVLLAPAAASMDMFRDYAERGELFAAAVRRLAEGTA